MERADSGVLLPLSARHLPLRKASCLNNIGRGSLRNDSVTPQSRLAARLRERGVAPIAEAGFLNDSRPTLAASVAKSMSAGATSVTVQPCFLIAALKREGTLWSTREKEALRERQIF